MLKSLLRSAPVLHLAGTAMGGYLKLCQATNRMRIEGQEHLDALRAARPPAIIVFWHGQHFMTPFALTRADRVAAIISRHGDGEINARAVAMFGIRPVRGSGAQRQDQIRRRGGAQALRLALSALKGGEMVSMTADVPKISRVAGRGVITLAQLAGAPIFPLAVVTSRQLNFNTWDRSSLALPFGRCATVCGPPIVVPREATDAEQEAARLAVQDGLDQVLARAYALIGRPDPGAGRESVMAARAAAARLAANGEP
jgi:hypothetical protein